MANYIEAIIKTLEEGKTFRIAFLGDSITSTEWVHPNWREAIEYALKEKIIIGQGEFDWKAPSWGIRCFNAGFDGATTDDMLELLDDQVLAYKPNMVILLGTVNDMDFGFSVEKHAKNIDKLITKLEKNVAHTVMSTSIYKLKEEYNKKYEEYINEVLKLTPFKKTTFINLFEEYKKFDLERIYTFRNKNDNPIMGISAGDIDFAHPNSLGNAYIAKVLLKKLFDIDFDPELYIKDSKNDEKYPRF